MKPELTTDKLEWEGPDSYGGYTSNDQYARWRLSGIGDVVNLKIYPHHPEGEDYMSLRAKRDELEKTLSRDSFECQKLDNYMGIGIDDIGFAESYDEAFHLTQMLHDGNEGFPPWKETLTSLGFEQAYPDDHNLSGMYKKYIRSSALEFFVRDDSVWVMYHGNNAKYWHNIAYLNGPVVTHDTGYKSLYYYPESVTNHIDILAKHIEWVIDQRTIRGGKFSKPLGELPRRYK